MDDKTKDMIELVGQRPLMLTPHGWPDEDFRRCEPPAHLHNACLYVACLHDASGRLQAAYNAISVLRDELTPRPFSRAWFRKHWMFST